MKLIYPRCRQSRALCSGRTLPRRGLSKCQTWGKHGSKMIMGTRSEHFPVHHKMRAAKEDGDSLNTAWWAQWRERAAQGEEHSWHQSRWVLTSAVDYRAAVEETSYYWKCTEASQMSGQSLNWILAGSC